MGKQGQPKSQLKVNSSILKGGKRSQHQKANSHEYEDPPCPPASRETQRTKATQASALNSQGFGVNITSSKLEAKASPQGLDNRVSSQRLYTPSAGQPENSKLQDEEKDVTNEVRRLIAVLEADNKRRAKEEEDRANQLNRAYAAVRRSLLHWYQAELVGKAGRDKSLTEDDWSTLRDMTDEQICGPARLTVQEAKIIRPGADLREPQNLTAHRLSSREFSEAIEAMEDSAEKSLYQKILQFKSEKRIL